jgi:SH3-like domain-containing protein
MKTAVVFFLAFLLIGTAVAEAGELKTGWAMCKPDSCVNIRSRPNKHSSVVAHAYMGDEITLTGKKYGKWRHCIFPCEAGEGWIRADYLSTDEPIDIGSGRFEVEKNRTLVRVSAGGKIIRRLNAGDVVSVYLITNEWCVTNKGFIKTECLVALPYEPSV